MPSSDLQSFYNDRRQRGLSDAIIYNELEAAGWPKAGLQERIAEARAHYEQLPSADFMVTADALEYSLVQPPKPKRYGRIFMVLATMTLYVYFSWQQTHDWVLIVPVFAVFGFVSFISLFGIFARVTYAPRRIRLDSQNVTVLDPPGHPHAWTSYVGYRPGEKPLTEAEQPEPVPAGPIFTFWKTKPPTRPVVKLFRRKRWLGVTSTDLALTLPLPLQRSAEVLAYIGAHLPELKANETSATMGSSWKLFVFGLGCIGLLVILAIIMVLGR